MLSSRVTPPIEFDVGRSLLRDRAYDIVAIGASAGGIPALKELLAALPPTFPLPILVVQHVSRTYPSRLPEVLGRCSGLAVTWAEHGVVPAPGSAYVAPANHHLEVTESGLLSLSPSPRVNYCRPSVDVLFGSVANVFGERAIAVVLSGWMRDGAAGLAAVRRRGGFGIAQDELTAEAFEMPAAAIDIGRADLILRPRRIADALELLADAGSDSLLAGEGVALEVAGTLNAPARA